MWRRSVVGAVGHLSTPSGCPEALAAYPPAEASNLYMPVYLALQLIGYAASGVAIGAGRLLPCLFTLTGVRNDLNHPGHRRLFSVIFPRTSPPAFR